ncbi:MAG: exo-beta-N-acetylmuramidase NamZ domain-containing protein [Fimbriimonadales bacterium]
MRMVKNGIDRLEEYLGELKRLRVGVITNHTGLTAEREPLIDFLRRLGITIGALFSPEHGFRGQLDERVPDSIDERTGLPIYSLYGERKKPTLQQLANLDALIFDIQDIGARYYTYISTMGLAMEAAAERNIPFYVLDRVNPIGGVVEGPLADADCLSFTAYHTLTLRHGMTVGELAQMFNAERGIGAELRVIPCTGWKRAMTLDECGLYWTNPSPNMRRLQQAFLYIGVGVWEGTNLSVGRGTDTPFEILGAPWIDGRKLAGMLNDLPTSAGVRFIPVIFTPTASTYKGVECQGVSIFITNREQLRPFSMGVGLGYCLRKLYPRAWEAQKSLGLLANREVHAMLMDGAEPERILQRCAHDVEQFTRRREPFLLYD